MFMIGAFSTVPPCRATNVADAPAFPSDEYAFPQVSGDDADQAEQRNQQIQAAFDQHRFQRNFIQGIAKSISRLQAQQKT